MAFKAKRNRLAYGGRPTYQPHEEGKWNYFDIWLYRRTMRTGYHAPPVKCDLFQCDWETRLPIYWHDPRHSTKYKVRDAGSARRLKTSVTRGYSKTAPRFGTSERQESSVSRHEPSERNTHIWSNEKLDKSDEDHAKKTKFHQILTLIYDINLQVRSGLLSCPCSS